MAEVGLPAPSPARKTHRGHRGGQRSHGGQQPWKQQQQGTSAPGQAQAAPMTLHTHHPVGGTMQRQRSSEGAAAGGSGAAAPATRETGGQVREAKGLAIELKNMLKRLDPWDHDVEFQRQAVRKQYRRLIFAHASSSSESTGGAAADGVKGEEGRTKKVRPVDAVTLLWLETSHAVIHLYRQRISAMDKTLEAANRSRRQPPAPRESSSKIPADGATGPAPGGGAGPKDDRNVGPVARRKLVNSFRSFLGKEEDFWKDLFVQLVQTFGIAEAQGALEALRLPLGSTTGTEDDEMFGLLIGGGHGRERSVGQARDATAVARKAIEREQALLLVHKALICFGDLARYRELYSEPPASSSKKPGAEQGRKGGRRGGRNTGGKDTSGVGGERNWARASECYHQARLLIPDNGNPSNQLAVVASYAGDPLSSAYHYYRALCVKTPFPTARPNLEIMYDKALHKWPKGPVMPAGGGEKEPGGRNRRRRKAPVEEQALAEGEGNEVERAEMVADRLRTEFVTLHAMLFTKHRFDEASDLNDSVCTLLGQAVRLRALPSELIVKIVVTAVAALWNARMTRNESRSSRTAGLPTHGGPPAIAVEALTVSHALDLFATLMDVATTELEGVVSSDSADDLSSNITAVLRRILPALRIISKWTIGHIDYVQRLEDRLVGLREDSVETLRPAKEAFWHSYADMINALTTAFSRSLLPSLDGGMWLEEDLDMLGFSPLRRSMREGAGADRSATDRDAATAPKMLNKAVHPNEEQLMRIADLQGDASLVALSGGSPIASMNGKLVALKDGATGVSRGRSDAELSALARQHLSDLFGPPGAQQQPMGLAGLPQQRSDLFAQEYGLYQHEEEAEDFADGLPSDADDDVVNMAMRAVVEQQMADDLGPEDDDEDEVVYPASRRATSQQPTAPGQVNATSLPVSRENTLLPGTRARVDSANGPAASPRAATTLSPPSASTKTAADLLLSLQSGSRPALSPPAAVSAVGPSIWAATPAEGFPSALGGISRPPGQPKPNDLVGGGTVGQGMSRQPSGTFAPGPIGRQSSNADIWAQPPPQNVSHAFPGTTTSASPSLATPSAQGQQAQAQYPSTFPDLALYQQTHPGAPQWQPQPTTLRGNASPFTAGAGPQHGEPGGPHHPHQHHLPHPYNTYQPPR